MDDINLEKDVKKLHFVGIGGISMSGLAETLHTKGFIITGSDNKETELIKKLKKSGIKIFIGQAKENVEDDVDLVIYTAAVKKDNPEMLAAQEKQIKTIDRAHLIGLMMKDFDFPICVSGTHGKTSTTSMISEIFLQAKKDPTINLGGILPSINSNFRIGSSGYFILESCEYFDSFLKFFPHIGVILNIEEDHLDYFKDLSHIENSFNNFARNIAASGVLVINSEIENLDVITKDVACKIVTYGKSNSDWQAKDISYDKNGFASFKLSYLDKDFGGINLKLHGEHNIFNAMAAIAASYEAGIAFSDIKTAIESFTGTKRRFENKGVLNGVTVIDDYAHHPTEIKATLTAAKNGSFGNIYCVFQPHTYSRTYKLFDELIDSFDNADQIILLDIFSAREKDTGIIHSKDLERELIKKGKQAKYFQNFDEAIDFIMQKTINNDLLITMGAGDVYLLGESLVQGKLSTVS